MFELQALMNSAERCTPLRCRNNNNNIRSRSSSGFNSGSNWRTHLSQQSGNGCPNAPFSCEKCSHIKCTRCVYMMMRFLKYQTGDVKYRSGDHAANVERFSDNRTHRTSKRVLIAIFETIRVSTLSRLAQKTLRE